MHKLLLLLVVSALATPLCCADDPQQQPQEALQGVLNQWKAAWNDKDISKTIAVYAPDSKMVTRLAKEGAKEKYVTNTQNIKDQLGDIVEISVAKYSTTGKAWIMKVKYDKMGLVPGTFTISKGKDAGSPWMLKSMFITGQGEPELAEFSEPKQPAEAKP
jgi:hypothetical protein